MISKELLSEVINIKIEDIVDLKMFGKDLKYYEKCLLKSCCDGRLSNHKDSICKSINIYELAHKCKEWALSKQYSLYSGYDKLINKYGVYINLSLLGDDEATIGGWDTEIYFIVDTEVEAIFKACQWLLDNN